LLFGGAPWRLVQPKQAMALPTHPSQPRLRPRHGSRVIRQSPPGPASGVARGRRALPAGSGPQRRVSPPPVEPRPGGEGVDSRSERAACVFAEVGEHVNQSRPYLPRRRERSTMPAVGPESSAAPDQVVDRARDPDGQAPHPGRQLRSAARLDDQVDVVVLDRVPRYPEMLRIASVGPANGVPEGRQNVLRAQRAEQRSQRDDHRVMDRVRRPSTVGRHPAGTLRFAPGPLPPTAPGGSLGASPGEGQRQLGRAPQTRAELPRHLERAIAHSVAQSSWMRPIGRPSRPTLEGQAQRTVTWLPSDWGKASAPEKPTTDRRSCWAGVAA